jgi:CBS domain-containing protein
MSINDPISSLMTTSVVCISPEQKLLDLKHIYEKNKFHHHVPVVEQGKLVGMVSLIDFMREVSHASLDEEEEVYHRSVVRDIMRINPVAVTPETPIAHVAEILSKGEIRSVVIAEENEIRGIVTTADIIRYFLKK